MRLMSYRLELTSDNGYVISNAMPDTGGTTATYTQVKAPGIKMNILDLPDACENDSDCDNLKSSSRLSREEFLNQFDFEEANWENPEFRECYRRVLCGEKSDWKLVSVHISHGYLWLEFASEKRYQELAEEDEVNVDSPYYSEGVMFNPCKYCGGRFHFEVERPDGLIETYKVTVEQDRTRIEEHIGTQKRTIRFDRRNDESGQWAIIEWYC